MRPAALVLSVLLLGSGTAFAQEQGDISAGYRFMRMEGSNFGRGWYFDAAAHLTDALSIVGDVGGSYRSESERFSGFTLEVGVKLHTFMGGLRLRTETPNANVIVFGHALFGVVNGRASTTIGEFTESTSGTDPAWNLSGGLDISGDKPVGLRVQVGWVQILADGGSLNGMQLSAGATFHF